MRFEAPRIHFTNYVSAAMPKFRFRGARLSVQVPEIVLRKLRLKKPGRFLINRPPELLKRIPDDAEARPTGFDKYARRFTAEGGIALSYKDVEMTLPIILGKLALWSLACFITYLAGSAWSPIDSFWWNLAAYVVLAIFYALLFFRPKQVRRTIEIRPDCMIIEGMETFWKENMPLGWPGFMPNDAGHFVLAGVYGTRWIEYLTIRRFDDNDRASEVFASQLAAAMKYQWEAPSKGA
jgi:hypothetical protein